MTGIMLLITAIGFFIAGFVLAWNIQKYRIIKSYFEGRKDVIELDQKTKTNDNTRD